MCATRASGTKAMRNGTLRQNVLDLEVVTASGAVVRIGSRARNSAGGHELTRPVVSRCTGLAWSMNMATVMGSRLGWKPRSGSGASQGEWEGAEGIALVACTPAPDSRRLFRVTQLLSPKTVFEPSEKKYLFRVGTVFWL